MCAFSWSNHGCSQLPLGSSRTIIGNVILQLWDLNHIWFERPVLLGYQGVHRNSRMGLCHVLSLFMHKRSPAWKILYRPLNSINDLLDAYYLWILAQYSLDILVSIQVSNQQGNKYVLSKYYVFSKKNLNQNKWQKCWRVSWLKSGHANVNKQPLFDFPCIIFSSSLRILFEHFCKPVSRKVTSKRASGKTILERLVSAHFL